MPRHVVLPPPSSVVAMDRKRPLLDGDELSYRGIKRPVTGKSNRFAEVAGGTAAECAAICCCCPCGLVNFLVLVVYKVPAGLCRKALRLKRRRALMKKGMFPPRKCRCNEAELEIHSVSSPLAMINADVSGEEVLALENEMWDKFYGAGFWRSPSQRSD